MDFVYNLKQIHLFINFYCTYISLFLLFILTFFCGLYKYDFLLYLKALTINKFYFISELKFFLAQSVNIKYLLLSFLSTLINSLSISLSALLVIS